jgi:hypothetical protein
VVTRPEQRFKESGDVIEGDYAVNRAGFVAKQIDCNRGILHQNHGLLTTSRHSVDDAAFWARQQSMAASIANGVRFLLWVASANGVFARTKDLLRPTGSMQHP